MRIGYKHDIRHCKCEKCRITRKVYEEIAEEIVKMRDEKEMADFVERHWVVKRKKEGGGK